eukprot:GILJ01000929.1.p1 GENE.GILJ01000929.1~~GILJ01000929.1.p1  ORF type:complete len:530 (+),score=71.46 GILJ01000929.1:39-1592(+)
MSTFVRVCIFSLCVALVSAGSLTRAPVPAVDKGYQVGYEFQVMNTICRLSPHHRGYVLRKGASLANKKGEGKVFAEPDKARGFAVQADDDVLPNLFYVEYVTEPFGSNVDSFCHMFGELSTEMARVEHDITQVVPTRIAEVDFGHGNKRSQVDVYHSKAVFPHYKLKCYWDSLARENPQPQMSRKLGPFKHYFTNDRQFLLNGQATITISKDRVYDFLVDPNFAGRFLYDAASLASFNWDTQLQTLGPNSLLAKADEDDVRGFMAMVALYIRESKNGHESIPKQDIPVLSRTDFAVWHGSLSSQLTFDELCDGVSLILFHMETQENHFELGSGKQTSLSRMKDLICGKKPPRPFFMFQVKNRRPAWSIPSRDWIEGLTLEKSVDRLTQSGSTLNRATREYYESMGMIKTMDILNGKVDGVRFEIRKLMDAVGVSTWAPTEENLCAALKTHLYIVMFNKGESVDAFEQPCPPLTSEGCQQFLEPLEAPIQNPNQGLVLDLPSQEKGKVDNPEEDIMDK